MIDRHGGAAVGRGGRGIIIGIGRCGVGRCGRVGGRAVSISRGGIQAAGAGRAVVPDEDCPGGAEAGVARLVGDGHVWAKADKRHDPGAAAIQQEALGRAAQAAKLADVELPTLAPIGIIYLATQRHIRVEGQHFGFAGTAVKQEDAGLQRPIKITGVDFPIARYIVLLVGGAHVQLVIEDDHAHLASLAVIEEDAIASGRTERADADLKGVVPAIKIGLAIHREG